MPDLDRTSLEAHAQNLGLSFNELIVKLDLGEKLHYDPPASQ